MPGTFYFDATDNVGYNSLPISAASYDESISQSLQVPYDLYGSQCTWTNIPTSLPYVSYPVYATQEVASTSSAQTVPSLVTTPSYSSQSSFREASSTPSCDSSLTRATSSYSPAPSRSPAVARSRSQTPATATIRPRKKRTQAKGHKTKVAASFRDRNRSWPRHILVRAKILPNEPVSEFRYHMIVLRSADVQSCGTAICYKLGIQSNGHKSIRWIDKASGLQGAVDSEFLSDTNDMQDFVVDIVGAGNNGYVELLLEM